MPRWFPWRLPGGGQGAAGGNSPGRIGSSLAGPGLNGTGAAVPGWECSLVPKGEYGVMPVGITPGAVPISALWKLPIGKIPDG